MANLTFENVRKVYRSNHCAVDGVSFSVNDGELLVLVGPSGSGKSTTLRMVAGLESVTSGSIRIDSKIVNNIPSKDRDVAMVFQNYALYPHMTVFNNMALGLKLRKYSNADIKHRVGQAAEILGITDILDRKPKQLSGGQQQRVAVGRAIVRKPKVFLFDEPFSNLDAKMRVQMRTELARLHRELNATMVYVTHDQTEAMTLGDRIVVMNEGIIQQIDEPVTLYKQPENLFVAGFIGSPAMNFIHGFFEVVDGTWQFISEKQDLHLRISMKPTISQPNHQVVLGFRPEDIKPVSNSQNNYDKGILDAEVVFIEYLGAESYVHAKIPSTIFMVRIAGTSNFRIGQRLQFELDLCQTHIFDANTDMLIARGSNESSGKLDAG